MENTILAFVIVAALALLVQTIGIIVLLLMARKAIKNVRNEMEQYRSSVMPLILRSRELVQTVAPKVETAAEELAVIATRLRKQTEEMQSAAGDIIHRTHSQVDRVDHMVSAVFDRVERAGVFMTDAVSKPMRQLSGIVAYVKAAVETLRTPAHSHRAHPRQTGYRYSESEPVVEPVVEPVAPPPPAGATTPLPPK